MIDATRWVLVEAWLSLGLRVEWSHTWRSDPPRDQLQEDDEGRQFWYEGHGRWLVVPRDRSRYTADRTTSPTLATETMAHELAHYLVSSDDDRGKVNFGLSQADPGPEERAVDAEKVVRALADACSRIATLSLRGER